MFHIFDIMKVFPESPSLPVAKIDLSDFGVENQELYLKREDLIHPFISGNKFRKLKYNVSTARDMGKDVLLTFGGAYSNHILAVAAAGKEFGFKTIGIIRGEEVHDKISQNPTLSFSQEYGMQLHFVSREEYRRKSEKEFVEKLRRRFGDFYLIPEGGTNELAVKGCEEILDPDHKNCDYICVPVGTGGTMAGLIRASGEGQAVLGFSALKGDFHSSEIEKYTSRKNYRITDSYCFGGYGKIDSTLVRFINEFHRKTQIQLDPLYTGKMVYGIVDLLKKGCFNKNSRIFAIHTGGLQGIAGMNKVLLRKKLPIIE